MFKFNKLVLLLIIALLSTQHVMARNNNDYTAPYYGNGELTIPRIDTTEQTGRYQSAKFRITDQGTWELLSFETFPASQGVNIESVEAIVTNSMPVQVFLKIRANFTTGCDYGQINQKLIDGKQFDVTVYPDTLQTAAEIDCAEFLFNPERIVPLSVFGLSAGTYGYSVNGEHVGQFALAEDNTLQLTCGANGSNSCIGSSGLSFTVQGTNAFMRGEIGAGTGDELRALMRDNPQVKTIVIASGGVDFFIAGTTRTIEPGAMVGVHAWSDGSTSAASLPGNDLQHRLFIDYYQSMGLPDPEGFYFFTINAASPEDIHYMTPNEIARYGLTN